MSVQVGRLRGVPSLDVERSFRAWVDQDSESAVDTRVMGDLRDIHTRTIVGLDGRHCVLQPHSRCDSPDWGRRERECGVRLPPDLARTVNVCRSLLTGAEPLILIAGPGFSGDPAGDLLGRSLIGSSACRA